MKILALDQSLNVTGWSVFEDGQLLDFSHFSIPANKPIEERLYLLWSHLEELESQFEFEKIIFEDIQHQANVETFKKLAYVQATILLWCYFREKSWMVMAPSSWRSHLKERFGIAFGRVRKEQKQVAQAFAKQHYNLQNVTEDEADSLCIGTAAFYELAKRTSAF